MRPSTLSQASTSTCSPGDLPPVRQSQLQAPSNHLSHLLRSALPVENQSEHPKTEPFAPISGPPTPAVHRYNHQRALMMQRKELHRCHQVWRKPFYGSATEREKYRKEIRELLKRQMEEKSVQVKLQRISKVNEADHLLEVDRLALSSEKQQRIQHSKVMTAYRDENKQLMERSWRDRALTRSQEALKERELLHLNPINWSGTQK